MTAVIRREDRRTPPTELDGEHRTVVVVGGGQAGLSMSRCLDVRGIDHLVLERDVVASSWKRHRWDTFSLVTPNWQCDLPDFPYAGPDPHGFMVRGEIVDYLEAYRAFVDPPLLEGVAVTRLHRDDRGTFVVETSAGTCTADQVVVATGGDPAAVRAAAGRHHADRVPGLPQPRPATAGGGAGGRVRAVRRPDRRGPAPGGAQGAPRRRARAAGGPLLPGP